MIKKLLTILRKIPCVTLKPQQHMEYIAQLKEKVRFQERGRIEPRDNITPPKGCWSTRLLRPFAAKHKVHTVWTIHGAPLCSAGGFTPVRSCYPIPHFPASFSGQWWVGRGCPGGSFVLPLRVCFLCWVRAGVVLSYPCVGLWWAGVGRTPGVPRALWYSCRGRCYVNKIRVRTCTETLWRYM